MSDFDWTAAEYTLFCTFCVHVLLVRIVETLHHDVGRFTRTRSGGHLEPHIEIVSCCSDR